MLKFLKAIFKDYIMAAFNNADSSAAIVLWTEIMFDTTSRILVIYVPCILSAGRRLLCRIQDAKNLLQ